MNVTKTRFTNIDTRKYILFNFYRDMGIPYKYILVIPNKVRVVYYLLDRNIIKNIKCQINPCLDLCIFEAGLSMTMFDLFTMKIALHVVDSLLTIIFYNVNETSVFRLFQVS